MIDTQQTALDFLTNEASKNGWDFFYHPESKYPFSLVSRKNQGVTQCAKYDDALEYAQNEKA